MEQDPHSPDEVIDPRWLGYLRAHQPEQPAQQPGAGRGDDVKPVHHASDAELNAEIVRALEPWRAGTAGPRPTLEALRDVANRLL
ncbi:MAG TPA: hypothetical protein VGK60_05510 [Pedococcus sp.]|jgi:hypothetical protein